MDAAQLRDARKSTGLTQPAAASLLGVSQPYYCQLERGSRPLTSDLIHAAHRQFDLSPTVLPLPGLSASLTPVPPAALASALSQLGYPGFAHLRANESPLNPAELVARALASSNLEPRLLEGLPWVLATFPDLDWRWLTAQSRLLDLQNRLGFLVSLAVELAKPSAAGSAKPSKSLNAPGWRRKEPCARIQCVSRCETGFAKTAHPRPRTGTSSQPFPRSS